MTISDSIIKWLYGFGGIDIDAVIDNDIIQSQRLAYAIAKTPNDIVLEEYQDGSYRKAEYYNFLIRRTTFTNQDRNDTEAFLEDLENWIHEQDMNYNLPSLGKNRICEEIKVTSGHYLSSLENDNGLYTITIEIIYRKEIN